MPFQRRVWGELFAMGIVAGLVAFGLAYATSHHGLGSARGIRGGAGARMDARTAAFVLSPENGRLSIRSADDAFSRDVELSLVVDGVARPVEIAPEQLKAGDGDEVKAQFPLAAADDTIDAQLVFHPDKSQGALVVDVRVRADSAKQPHAIALRAELASHGQSVFVSGTGEVADRANVSGPIVVVEAEPHPMGIVSSRGPLAIGTIVDDPTDPNEQMRVEVTSPAATLPSSTVVATDLRIAVGQNGMELWRALYALAGVPTTRIKGNVTGTSDRARIFGRDSEGSPQVRVTAAPDGSFDFEVPATVVEWYAAIDAARASALASYVPGSAAGPLVLDVSPGGELLVSIVDADTKQPITARLAVRGIEGTLDPSFGPDYRATGAGPLIDALHGAVKTPLPSGKYRVLATKGIEWSVDYQDVVVGAGRQVEVKLAPRHVLPTPGVLGCDLHVHSRPSFDSPVSVEDRVLSLVAAGIDFAVPTEHNVVGDYSSAIDTFSLGHEFSSVTGVEITTLGHGFGHFGVFPYPKGTPVPPYRYVSMAAMVAGARGNDPRRFFQVHHPRLPKGIGYFTNIGFYPKQPREKLHGRFDFDGIEVYNGYDIETLPRVEEVLRDYHALLNFGYRHVATGSSDSHRIQFHWAGYPRTMVFLDGGPKADTIDEAFDPLQVVAQIKKGHSIVTSGPYIEWTFGGVHPGDEVMTTDDPIQGHLRVRAAPWIDVSSIQIVVNGKMVQNFPVPSRPTKIGKEEGSIDDAYERTIRFDQDVTLTLGEANVWVQVIVRGDRKMDDVLPFMPVQPFGFTNPIWITRKPVPPPPLIIAPPPSSAKAAGGAVPAPPPR